MQQGLFCRFVGAPLAVQVCKGAEIRVPAGVFHGLCHGGGTEHLHGAGVRRGKVRGDVQCLKMLVEQVQTKGVDGADGGTLQQHPLTAQGGIAGLLAAELQQRLPDAGTELCRRCVGKGDDEQPVCIHRVLRVGDELHRPLGQHGGLAAAGGSAHQQRTAPVLDRRLLCRGPLGSTHGCSSFSSSSVCSGSKGFWGASSPRSPMPVSWQQIKL